jgi:SAM-dependent methyltransferase
MIDFGYMNNCLACGSENLYNFCSLGSQPLANNLKDNIEDPDELYPLEVNVCMECYHSQLTVAVNRDLLYKNYLYVSGTSNTLLKEFDEVAEIITADRPNKGRILDIACNDGSFLKSFRRLGWDVAGVDPAENIVANAPKDLNIVADFFPSHNISGEFDVITCFNVVAHIPNPLEFIKECKKLLSRDGVLYIQTSQKDMIMNGEFDTIYHEHHSFFNISSMKALLKRANMALDGVDYRPVHGTSYLFKITHSSTNEIVDEPDLVDAETYVEFADKVMLNKTRLMDIIRNSTNPVVGYGAAAKGVVMSNYFGISHKFIVDENPLKIGKVIGGVNIPIVSPDTLAQESSDLTIIVYAWNFYDEIASKIRQLRPNNSDLIIKSMEH